MTIVFTPTFPHSSKIATFGSSENKSQLIEVICGHLLSICCSSQMQYYLIVKGSSMIPRQVKTVLIIETTDLSATHNKDAIIIA